MATAAFFAPATFRSSSTPAPRARSFVSTRTVIAPALLAPHATSVAVDDDDDAADDDARATATASLCRLCISRSTGPMAGGAYGEEGSGVGDDIRAI
jgi:hypothetical protein